MLDGYSVTPRTYSCISITKHAIHVSISWMISSNVRDGLDFFYDI